MAFETRCKQAASTTLHNTMGTREYFKPFKKSRSASTITELWTINDWKIASTDDENHQSQRAASNATTPATVLAQARAYYEWLFAAKEHLLETRCVDALMRCLAKNPIPLAQREACESAITEKDIKKSIKKAPLGKACGPDGIPVELYRVHAEKLAPILAAALRSNP